LEERKENYLEIDIAENRFLYQFENCRNFSTFECENDGRDIENGINNLNINPKKRRLDCSQDKQFNLKKIH